MAQGPRTKAVGMRLLGVWAGSCPLEYIIVKHSKKEEEKKALKQRPLDSFQMDYG